MAYVDEFRINARPLAGAMIGMSAGLSLITYVNSIFIPILSAEFGWTNAQFALISSASIVGVLAAVVIGRLTDTLGVRAVATFGVIGLPLIYVGFSRLGGDIRQYYVLFTLLMLVGSTTTAVVYSRVIAEQFFSARGLALAVAACGAPITGALAAPTLSAITEGYGWRHAYLALAALTATFGLLSLFLLSGTSGIKNKQEPTPRALDTRAAYSIILRTPVLWVLVLAMLACNLPGLMMSLQLMPMLLDLGATPTAASLLISVYASGVIVGRLTCGLALDFLPAHLVAAAGMGLPALGYSMLAATPDTTATFILAVGLIGLSQGAEGDISAYLVARYFPIELYSAVFGVVIATLGLSAALGGVILATSLNLTAGYQSFLVLSAITVVIGSSIFLMLGRARPLSLIVNR